MIQTIYGEFDWITTTSEKWLVPLTDVEPKLTGNGLVRIRSSHTTFYVPNTALAACAFIDPTPDVSVEEAALAWLIERGVIDPLRALAQDFAESE